MNASVRIIEWERKKERWLFRQYKSFEGDLFLILIALNVVVMANKIINQVHKFSSLLQQELTFLEFPTESDQLYKKINNQLYFPESFFQGVWKLDFLSFKALMLLCSQKTKSKDSFKIISLSFFKKLSYLT